MAEVDTQMLAGQHADIRREGAEHASEIRYDVATRAGDIRHETARGFDKTSDLVAATASDIRLEQAEQSSAIRRETADQSAEIRYEVGQGVNEIVKEGLKGTHEVFAAVRDNRYDLASRIENAADRTERGISETRMNMADRFYGVGRDLAELRQGHATLSKDIELNALKTQLDSKANTQYIADKLVADGEKTRGLINDMKYHDLNRALVERNAELVNAEHDHRHYRDRWLDGRFDQNQAQFAGQWAQLQNQVQAFASQLQETRQGMVNFGAGANLGQTSTSNNVR
jgi:hypothetical protein